MRQRRLLASSAAAALLVAGIGTTPSLAGNKGGNPNNSDKFTRAVAVEAIVDHLEVFQDLADEHGNRAAGTPGYEAAAGYLETELAAAGYQTERQYFTFIYEEVIADDLTENSPDQREWANIPMGFSPNTPDGGVTAAVAAPTDPSGCVASSYPVGAVTGKIALVSRGGCSFAQKSVVAGQAGAVALIVYNNVPGPLNGTLGSWSAAHIPSTGITQADGQALVAKLPNGLNLTLDLRNLQEERETFNIIAETDTGRSDNVVMMGAHFDSVQEGPGINDNGSGSAALLEVAIQMAEVNKVNNRVRFAWWGAEELGLLGSRYYVNDLVANDPEELQNIATYLNFDMVASPNYVIGVYDADESTYPAPTGVPIPEGSVASEDVFTDYFDSIGQPWVDTAFSGRSDYQAFILNGVPASGLFTGADGVKTAEQVELFGGTAGITYDPNYHSPADDIDNVSVEALDIMSDAMAHAAITLAQDTSSINGKRSAGKSGNPHPRGPVPVPVPEEDAA